MKKLLASLPENTEKNVLVGFETSDDAGVYRLNDEQALVFTADFITPPVDDPFLFGQIAAANSLSDIYAMGGKPLSCLNLAGFPSDKLDHEILKFNDDEDKQRTPTFCSCTVPYVSGQLPRQD